MIFDVLDRIVGDVTVAWVITWLWLSSLHSPGARKDPYEDDDENGQDEEDDGSWRLFVVIKAMNDIGEATWLFLVNARRDPTSPIKEMTATRLA